MSEFKCASHCNEHEYEDRCCFRCPRGPKGEKGEQGCRGEKGEPGRDCDICDLVKKLRYVCKDEC